jgi:hypothetical protein
MVHSVSLSVVIALLSEDVSLLGKELFQVSGLSDSEAWPGCCSRVLKPRGSVTDLWLFSNGWGHQRDWLTVCQGGSFREHSRDGYLPAVSARALPT